MRESTSVRTVGCIKDRWRVPPVLSRAPCRTASSIQVSTLMAARSSIKGPMTVESSAGFPACRDSTRGSTRSRKGVIDFVVEINALDGDTGLSGIRKSARDATLGGLVKVGIGFDDDRGIASQLEQDLVFFLLCLLKLQPTAALPVKLKA